jgi:hypothetical protein
MSDRSRLSGPFVAVFFARSSEKQRIHRWKRGLKYLRNTTTSIHVSPSRLKTAAEQVTDWPIRRLFPTFVVVPGYLQRISPRAVILQPPTVG